MWVCSPCGTKWGQRQPDSATWHEGFCDICGLHDAVTEPRDFGHLSFDAPTTTPVDRFVGLWYDAFETRDHSETNGRNTEQTQV